MADECHDSMVVRGKDEGRVGGCVEGGDSEKQPMMIKPQIDTAPL
jgi:hypothetical protein